MYKRCTAEHTHADGGRTHTLCTFCVFQRSKRKKTRKMNKTHLQNWTERHQIYCYVIFQPLNPKPWNWNWWNSCFLSGCFVHCLPYAKVLNLALFFSLSLYSNTHYMIPFWCRSFSLSRFASSCSLRSCCCWFFVISLWLLLLLIIIYSPDFNINVFFSHLPFLCWGFGAWQVSSAVIKKILYYILWLRKKYEVLTVCGAFNVGTYSGSHVNGTIEFLLYISSLHVEQLNAIPFERMYVNSTVFRSLCFSLKNFDDQWHLTQWLDMAMLDLILLRVNLRLQSFG